MHHDIWNEWIPLGRESCKHVHHYRKVQVKSSEFCRWCRSVRHLLHSFCRLCTWRPFKTWRINKLCNVSRPWWYFIETWHFLCGLFVCVTFCKNVSDRIAIANFYTVAIIICWNDGTFKFCYDGAVRHMFIRVWVGAHFNWFFIVYQGLYCVRICTSKS